MLKKHIWLNKAKEAETIALTVIVAAYLAFTFSIIMHNSVWFDEAFTSFLMRQDNFGGIIYYTSLDVHPPLYYLLLKVWTLFGGPGLFCLRAFSILIGAISIILFDKVFKKFFAFRNAHPLAAKSKVNLFRILAVAIFAFNPFFLRYTIEARMYILDVLFCIASSLVLYDLLFGETARIKWVPQFLSGVAHPFDADEETASKLIWKQVKAWALFGLLCVAGMYTHYFYIFIIAAQIIWAIAVKKLQAFNIYSISTFVISVICYIPWIPVALSQFSLVTKGFWIPPSKGDTFFDFFSELIFFIPFDEETTIYLVATIIFLVLILVRAFLTVRPAHLIFLASLCLIPPAYLVIVDAYVSRYAICSTFALVMLAVLRSPGEKQMAILKKNKVLNKSLTVIPIIVLIVQLAIGLPNLITIGNYSPYDHKKETYSKIVETIKNNMVVDANYRDTDKILVRDYNLYLNIAAYEDPQFQVYYADNEYEQWWASYQMLSDYEGRGHLPEDQIETFLRDTNRVWVVTAENEGTVTLYVNGLPTSETFNNLAHSNA